MHARDGHKHRLVVVLPETAKAGATIFTERLAEKLSEYLATKGAKFDDGGLAGVALTFPDDKVAIETLRTEFAAIDKTEHPEAEEAPA